MEIETLYRLLSEPARLKIIGYLRGGESRVGELAEELGLPQPTVSRHLGALKAAGLVSFRADGTARLYALRPRSELFAALEVVERACARVRST